MPGPKTRQFQRPRKLATNASPPVESARSESGEPSIPVPYRAILSLQRGVGNAATVRSLQRAANNPRKGDLPQQLTGAIRSAGTPLRGGLLQRLERHVDADLASVRVHVDRSSTEALSAAAYTVGDDVVVHPDSTQGPAAERTLAHEVTHVVQQRSGPVHGDLRADGIAVSDPADREEVEAARSADAYASGRTLAGVGDGSSSSNGTSLAPTVQRQGEGTSVKERLKLFQGQPQTPEPKSQPDLPGLGDRAISFKDALKFFQDLSSLPEAKLGQLEKEGGSSTETTERTYGTPGKYSAEGIGPEQGPTTEQQEPTTEEKQEPSLPQPESLKGGKWEGKELDDLFLTTEKANLDKHQKGLAFAGWAPQEWKGTEALHVKYLTKEERAGYELKLLKDKGSPVFFLGDKVLDTSKMVRKTTLGQSGEGKMIFVMDVKGRIFVADEGAEKDTGWNVTEGLKWRFNHSSFLQGEPVASAGELWFKGGVLQGISDESGHYRPRMSEMLQLLRHFKDNGVDLTGVILQIRGKPVDAEVALEQDDLKQAQSGLETFRDELDDFKRYGSDEEFAKAVKGFASAREHSSGVDLTNKARQLAEATKTHTGSLVKELSKDEPDVDETSDIAASVKDAVDQLSFVGTGVVSPEAHQTADALSDETYELFKKWKAWKKGNKKSKESGAEPEPEPKWDFDPSRALAYTLVSQLGEKREIREDSTAEDEIDERLTNLNEISESLLEDTTRAIAKVKGGNSRSDLVEIYDNHADVFGRIVKIVTKRAGLKAEELVRPIENDFLDDFTRDEAECKPPDGEFINFLNLVSPGAGQRFQDENDWDELERIAKPFTTLADPADGGDALSFANRLLDESDTALDDDSVESLKRLLEARKETLKAFVNDVLIYASDDQDDEVDTYKVLLAASLLIPGSVQPKTLAKYKGGTGETQ